MIQLNAAFLADLQLDGLPAEEANLLLRHVYETLETRVGFRLANAMTNKQLDDFEEFYEADDDEAAFKWLETNFPNYPDVVHDEFNLLRAEIREMAPTILSMSGRAE